MVPYFRSDANLFLTPDPMSNPIMYYIKWVVSEGVNGFNSILKNDAYTDGICCPYDFDLEGQWMYHYKGEWYNDPTLQVKCTDFVA